MENIESEKNIRFDFPYIVCVVEKERGTTMDFSVVLVSVDQDLLSYQMGT